MTGLKLKLRIGVAVGPIVAGVIGFNRPQFDIFGDTVNTASRMESNGVVGSIHITKETYLAMKGKHVAVGRGEIYIKGKGDMVTFLVYLDRIYNRSDAQFRDSIESIESMLARLNQPSNFIQYFRQEPEITYSPKFIRFRENIPKSNAHKYLMFNDPKLEQDYSEWNQFRMLIVSRLTFIIAALTMIITAFGYEKPPTPAILVFVWMIILHMVGIACTFTRFYIPQFQNVACAIRLGSHVAIFAVTVAYGIFPIPNMLVIKTLADMVVCYHLFLQRFRYAAAVTIIDNILFSTAIILKDPSQAMSCISVLLALSLFAAYTEYFTERHHMESFHYLKVLEKQMKDVRKQKETSENILQSILPKFIIERLRQVEQPFLSIQNPGEEATVLVTDIVNFTKLCSSLSAFEVVTILNKVFDKFDELCEEHSVVKVKTVGDAIIVAANLSEYQPNHAERVVRYGLAIIDALETMNRNNDLGVQLSIRVGIHTGQVWAGVIRTKSFSFDIWGDTLTISNLFESQGEPNTVCISEKTNELVSGVFETEKGPSVTFKNEIIKGYKVCRQRKMNRCSDDRR